MFTGIIEEIGVVEKLERGGGTSAMTGDGSDARLTVRGPLVASDARLGDSIAVGGVCLTVTDLPGDGTFTVDVMPESLRRTALGDLATGSPVNLERAVRADGRLGGHIVQGHVDGVGTIVRRAPGPRWDDVEIDLAPDLARYVAEKGSITVSGVSLTVTHVRDDGFGVSLIPTTLEATTLGRLAPGAQVNIEVDVLAKYVERLLATGGVTR
jgi:riboflavin synthase